MLVQATTIAPTNSFFLARHVWAERAPVQVATLLDAINGAAVWAKGNPDALAGLMAEVTGVPIEAHRVAAPRGVYAVQRLDSKIIAQQQEIADTFARLRIIPARVDVRRAVWASPAGRT